MIAQSIVLLIVFFPKLFVTFAAFYPYTLYLCVLISKLLIHVVHGNSEFRYTGIKLEHRCNDNGEE